MSLDAEIKNDDNTDRIDLVLKMSGTSFYVEEDDNLMWFDGKSSYFGVSFPNVERVFTVGITPFAIFFIEIAVGFAAHITVLKRHSAALANQLSRGTEKSIDRHVKQFGKKFERICIRYRFAGFPA